MDICNRHSRSVCRAVILLLIFVLMIGCGAIQPYEPRNNREEGPEKGLFTGSEGEWVIYRKADEKASDSEDQKGSDQNKDTKNEDDGQFQSSE
jgi:hypothetical protein